MEPWFGHDRPPPLWGDVCLGPSSDVYFGMFLPSTFESPVSIGRAQLVRSSRFARIALLNPRATH